MGSRRESVRVCLRDIDGSWEYSEENEAVRGSRLELALGVERVDILTIKADR